MTHSAVRWQFVSVVFGDTVNFPRPAAKYMDHVNYALKFLLDLVITLKLE